MSRTIKEAILSKSLQDIGFAKDVLSNLPSKLFNDTDGMNTVYTVLRRNALSDGEALSQQAISSKIENLLDRQKADNESVENTLKYLNDLYKVRVDNEDKSMNEQIERYVKTEMSKDVLVKFISENKQENSEYLNELIEQLKEIEVKDISGTNGVFIDFFKDLDKKKELLKTIHQNKFSTGFKTLDNEIEGGIARGEVGLFIAPTGKGKSFFASNLARNYVKSGLNVLYVALEELENRMILRAEQQIGGIEKTTLLDDNMELREDVYDKIQEVYKDKLFMYGDYYISKNQPNEVTPSRLEQLIINTSIRKDKHIDVVIIDYPRLMRNPYSRYNDESDAGGKLFEDIRKLAQKYNFLCWTLAQTNRSASSAEVVTREHVEGSRKILNTVELVLVLNQTSEEFQNGYLRLYLDKVRNGSRSGSEFVHLKVEPEKMRIRDSTKDEMVEHMSILANGKEQDKSKFEKNETKRKEINSFGSVPL